MLAQHQRKITSSLNSSPIIRTFILLTIIFGIVVVFERSAAAAASTITPLKKGCIEKVAQMGISNITNSENQEIPVLFQQQQQRPKRWRPGSGYNNCFFTPMNCDVTGRRWLNHHQQQRHNHRLRTITIAAHGDEERRNQHENSPNGSALDLSEKGKAFRNSTSSKNKENHQQKGLLRRRSTKNFTASKMPFLLKLYNQQNK